MFPITRVPFWVHIFDPRPNLLLPKTPARAAQPKYRMAEGRTSPPGAPRSPRRCRSSGSQRASAPTGRAAPGSIAERNPKSRGSTNKTEEGRGLFEGISKENPPRSGGNNWKTVGRLEVEWPTLWQSKSHILATCPFAVSQL